MLANHRGFTLLETTIVLALMAGFGLSVVGYFSGLREQTQFSDSIDSVKNEIIARRQEAMSTTKLSGGYDNAHISVGRMLIFKPGANTIDVKSLYTDNSTSPHSVYVDDDIKSDTSDIRMLWQSSYLATCPSSVSVAFIRSPIDGTLYTAAKVGVWSAPYAYDDVVSSTALAANFKIPIVNNSGNKGYITVDARASSFTAKVVDTGSVQCP
jgi:prepilin-type N-terminal cleavage/methylation domain-containing protein